MSVARVRWDNNMGEFVPLHFTETMIDHLEIDSVIHHVDSDEARAQVRTNSEKSKGVPFVCLIYINEAHIRSPDMLVKQLYIE